MTRGLLTCPFCGSEPEMMPAEVDKGLAAIVRCTWEHCAAQPSVAGYETKQAIAFWNHRRSISIPSHDRQEADLG